MSCYLYNIGTEVQTIKTLRIDGSTIPEGTVGTVRRKIEETHSLELYVPTFGRVVVVPADAVAGLAVGV